MTYVDDDDDDDDDNELTWRGIKSYDCKDT